MFWVALDVKHGNYVLTPNVEVTGAARLCRAASVLTAGLAYFANS